MWSARFDTIQVPLLTPEQLAQFKQWISHATTQQFSVLPNFQFTYKDPVRLRGTAFSFKLQCTVVHCKRETTLPAQEAVVPTISYYREEDGLARRGLECAYMFCLWRLSCFEHFHFPEPTQIFEDAVDQNRNWITRRLSFVGENLADRHGFNDQSEKFRRIKLVHEYFQQLAARKEGRDWSKANFVGIAHYLYNRAPSYTYQDRKVLDKQRILPRS